MNPIKINCDFCLNVEKNGQPRSINDVPYAVRNMIEKIFWFTSEEFVNLNICPGCQNKLLDFFEFYSKAEGIYKQRLKKDGAEENSTHANDKAAVEGTEDEIEIKLEPLEYDQSSDEDDAIDEQAIDESPSDTESTIPKATNGLTERNPMLKKISDDDILSFCNLNCHVCSYKFSKFGSMLQHCKNIHNQQGYAVCCRQRFEKLRQLRIHILLHINPDALKCSECNKHFTSNISLKKHMSHAHVPGKQFQCGICQEMLGTRGLLQAHKRTHKTKQEFLCIPCDKQFSTDNSLKIHNRTIHERGIGHVCDICLKVFKTKENLQIHLVEHENKESIVCTVCGESMKNQITLDMHMKRHTKSTMAISCHICGQQSQTTEAMREHIQEEHKIKRRHPCTVCKRTYRKQHSLKEHMAMHAGEVLYKCDFCDKRFYKSGTLSLHRKNYHAREWEELLQNKPKSCGPMECETKMDESFGEI
ncbi:zinc finger protein 557-like [Uranotaenia lowii]|uniref:zinc finger protein 557-like n=1 Tax=Uranotaenia lowii TaxID=190385 RepID=UPI0024793936|nr:zinc finger protein 557-like [Uranotaenia lowii]